MEWRGDPIARARRWRRGPSGPSDAVSSIAVERFAAALRAWWRPHAHYGSLRALTAPQSLALWLGPAQEWVRAWLLGAFAEPPSKAETEMLADAAWLCLRANEG